MGPETCEYQIETQVTEVTGKLRVKAAHEQSYYGNLFFIDIMRDILAEYMCLCAITVMFNLLFTGNVILNVLCASHNYPMAFMTQ